jgi:hypothetical protein
LGEAFTSAHDVIKRNILFWKQLFAHLSRVSVEHCKTLQLEHKDHDFRFTGSLFSWASKSGGAA